MLSEPPELFLSPAKAAGRRQPRFLLCPGLWDRPCPQLPAQEVKSLCVNKAWGQQVTNASPGEASARPGLFPAGLLQGIKHSFQADSLDSYKADPAKGAAEAAQEERSLSETSFEKKPSFLLLLLLKRGIASGGAFTVSEVKPPCLGFSSLIVNFNCTVGLN